MDKSDKKKGELIEKGIKVVTSGNAPVKLNYLIKQAKLNGIIVNANVKMDLSSNKQVG